MGGAVGLDYTACKVVSEALDYPFDDVTIRRLRMIENEILQKQASDEQHDKHNNKGD